ncbi:HEAT repeat domain-containing protein [Streptomyces sp. NPDC047981]|uniref:HEAT repeat domain-containing protein n=1 Tax=Streptomyces sp. NPDC047981 TaxID=3154610 RepID=UPI003442D799
MATFVHLTPAANAPRIRRGGIRALSRGRGSGLGASGPGTYLFPVLHSYPLTHQWLRELARRPGTRDVVAVHVRLADAEAVTVGRYGDREPVETTAADAVRVVRGLDDPRGWEVFLPRAVERREVRAVRRVRQVNGWRYFPDAHGRTPCTCQGCLARGEYGGRRLRERHPHPLDGPHPPPRVLLGHVEAAEAAGDSAALREALRRFAYRRRGPLPQLAHLARHPDPGVRIALVEAVGYWSTPGVDSLVRELACDPDPDVSEAARSVSEQA